MKKQQEQTLVSTAIRNANRTRDLSPATGTGMERNRSRLWTRSALFFLCSVLATLGAIPLAEAHNLQTRMVYMFLDGGTQTLLDNRIAGGWTPGTPILQAGDEIGLITKVIPDPAGTTTGVGGHVDFYVPDGVTVTDVGYMVPDGSGGFTKAPMKGQSPIALGDGPIGAKTTPELIGLSGTYTNVNGVTQSPADAAGKHRGTIAGVYGDTGIFYSTDPDTAWGSWQAFTGDAVGVCGSKALHPTATGQTITNNSGDVVVPCNKWDAEQLFGWGAKGTTYSGAALRGGSLAIVDYPDQRGNAPWGFASGVAGPQSGYAWEFDWDAYKAAGGNPASAAHIQAGLASSKVGPWKRIQYSGSRVSYDQAGLIGTTLGYASQDASNLGILPNALPSTTSQTDGTSPKTIRFAVGQLTQGRPEYVLVKFRIDNPNGSFLDAQGCPFFHSDTFGGDAGGSDNGKDHLWRYYEPSIFNWNGCLAAGKAANLEFAKVGDIVQYKVKAYNLGTQTLTNVKITDTLPSGLSFLSASPAQTSGPSPLVWNVGTLQPGQKFESLVTVKVTGTGQLSNCITVTSNERAPQQTCDTTYTSPTPYLIQAKSATPTSIAPGAPVTYTLTVTNIGSGATASPVTVTDYLPSGFTYASLVGATVNGAAVTPTVNATNPSQPVFSVASAINAGKTLTVTFSAATSAGTPPGSYCNTYTVTQNSIPLTSGSLACVSVAGGQIGDTLFRDWNGNGVQDAGEEGLPGVTVTLSGDASRSVVTDADGNYLFSGLAAGNYTVTVPNPGSGGVPSGYTLTADPDGAPIGASYSLSLAQDEQRLDVDFGYKPGGTASIGDKVFEDKNLDAAFNGSDVGIDGVTVFLYEDTNGNGILNTGDNLIATTTTSGGGNYSFTGLDPARGYLVVAVDGSGSAVDTYFPNPYQLTTNNPWSVTPATFTAQSNAVTTADFGYYGQTPGSIGDQVFIDGNGNGVYDSGEAGIPNITVWLYIDLNGNGSPDAGELLATASTDGNGVYGFPNLGPANYIVVVDTADPDLPQGYVTNVPKIQKTLSAGENHTLADFPFRPLLAKTVDKASAANGNTLTFTLKPSYPGSDLLDTLRVMDPVPSNTTYLSSSPTAASTGAYVRIVAVNGSDADLGNTSVTTSSSVVVKGGSVNITLNVTNSSGASISGVTPSLVVDGGSASCGSPSPASATIANASNQNFVWSCTLNDIAEYTFTGSADSGANGWPDATSASVLVVGSGSSTSNIVTWNLGSNTPGVPSADTVGGSVDTVYALTGNKTTGFNSYGVVANAWTAKTAITTAAGTGGSLTLGVDTGTTYLYALSGNNTKKFYRYDLSGNSWTGRTDTPAAIQNVGQDLTTLGNNIYAFKGNGTTTFYAYSISGNSWSTKANAPWNVKLGGSLTNNGTNVYALQGNNATGFARYNVATNDWTSLAAVPAKVGSGGALVRVGGYLYAFTGNSGAGSDKTLFYRYDIAANTWAKMASAPGNVDAGGALTTDGGNYVYAFQGKTTAFWRYNISANTWTTTLTAYTAATNVGAALQFVPGVGGTVARTSNMAAGPTLVTQGGSFQVTMTLYSAAAANNVAPGSLTQTATNGASASCALQSPTTQNIPAGGTVTFTWNCTATTAGTLTSPNYSSVKYSATATNGSVSWTSATTNTVLISPVLNYTTTIGTFPASCVIPNTGIVAEQGGSLGSGPSNTTQTTGTSCGASIGDFVWSDANGNGAQDTGEIGIAGVKVYIDANANGQWDSGETYTTTDLNGAYHFYGLAAGTYTVRTDASTYPSGYTPTTPVFVTQAVAANSTNNNFDFGLQAPGTGSIGDTVWLDADSDGVQDAGEAPLPGIGVKLYRDLNGNGTIDVTDVLIGTASTDVNGNYEFTGLPIGSGAGSPVKYLVQVDTGSSVDLPYPYSGGPTTSTLGAAMAPTTGTVNPKAVSLYTGHANVTDADFGYNWSGVVGDTVFYDTDGNGIQNGGEGGAANVTLAIVWDQNGNGEADFGEPALTAIDTNGSGQYFFTHLPPGRYVVQVSGQMVESPTNPGVYGTMVPTASYGENYAVDLPAGGSVLTADFGFIEAARVEGHVFHDANNSGVFDGGESGLGNGTSHVTVTLSGTDLNGGPVSLTKYTAADGSFDFLVPPGVYTVTYTTGQTTALGYPAATTVTSYAIAPLAGQEITNLNFGVSYNGSLGDRVWNDANGNGIQDAGEPGIAGVTVKLYASDGTTLLAVTATDGSGLYGFQGLANGSYVVKVDPATLPAGYTATGEGDPGTACGGGCDHSITASVSGGAANNGVDFGYKPPANTHSIGGTVWNDQDGGGTQNGEPGIGNVGVCLYQSNGTTLVSCTTTNGSGAYSFPGLADGGYVVKVDPATLPSGAYAQTGDPDPLKDNQTAVTLSGADVTGKDFGYQEQLGSIAGKVCLGNGNGQCEAGEGALQGVTVTLKGAGPDGVLGTNDDTTTTTTTDANGAYSFANLLPGPYQVIETNPQGLASVADADGGNPDNIAVTLTAGQHVTGRDFEDGASIGDYVWFDSNHDGIQQPSEKGIAGVAVTLYAADGTTVLKTTQTDGSGFYEFTGLGSGGYQVGFTAPAGYQFTLQNQGSGPLQDSFDSDADTGTGKASVTLTTSNDVTIDAGLYLTNGDSPARIGDFVWYDTDHDGVQDAGEPGLGGVTVKLRDGTGTTVLATTVSDGNGYYEFAGLPAGSYVVEFATPAGYTRSPKDAGGDAAKDSDADVTTGLTATITLAAGQNLTTVDAGLYLTGSNPGDAAASIGNFVWYDSDGNGVQDGGEPGIPGVVVRLYDAAGTTLLSTSQTDPTGQYVFAGLAAGSYTVEFVKPNAGYAFSPTGQGSGTTDSDADVATGRVQVTVTSGQVRTDIDAGLRVPGQNPISIGDYVWKDANGDGQPDSGEGLPAVQVVLYDSLGNELARLTTNAADANYTFTGVPAGGSYRVEVDTSTLDPSGLVEIADPDATLDNRTDLINLSGSTTAVDFGYALPPDSVTLSGTVFHDLNQDQLQDGGEPGTNAGGQLYVTAVDGGNQPVATVPVAADGSYSLTVTANTSYTLVLSTSSNGVVANLPAGWNTTGENSQGTPDGNPNGQLSVSVGYSNVTGQNFGIDGNPPHADNDSAVTPHDVNVDIPVLDNDDLGAGATSFDPATIDLDPSTPGIQQVLIVPGEGTYTVNPTTGVVTFDPEPDFSGPATPIPYTIRDNLGQMTNPALISIVVGPEAVDDTETTPFNTPLSGDVPGNDVYPAGSVFSKTSEPSHGSVAFNPDGSYVYTPATGYSGTDTFTYQVCLPAPNGTVCDPATVTITIQPPVVVPPELQIQKTASTTQPTVGLPFTYTLTVTNSGGPAANPQVIDTLPAGVKLTAVSGGSWTCTPSAPLPLQGGSGATLGCTKASMTAGAEETLTLTAVPTAVTGSFVNVATITGDGDTPPANPSSSNCAGGVQQNCDRAIITPANPRLELIKKVSLLPGNDGDTDNDGQAEVGEKLTYTFTLTNRGDVALTPVTLTDAQLDAVPAATCATTSLGHAFALGGTLLPNESVVCTGKHSVTAAEESAGRIDNTATATGQAPDQKPVQSTSTGLWDNTPAVERGQLTLTKTAVHHDANGNGRFDEGETVTYGFIVRNVGTTTVHDLAVDDPMFALVTCPYTALAAGTEMICTVPDHVLTTGDVTSGKVVNTATATGRDPSDHPLSDTDTKVLNSGQPAGLELEKTAVLTTDQGTSGLTVGDTLTYTLVATNTGGVALTNVTVTDNKVGTKLQAANACVPAQGSTLNPGARMVCAATYQVQEGEDNPVDNTANVTGKPVGQLAPVDASSNHVVPYTVPAVPVPPLYTIGDRVWLDTDNNGVMAATELGIDGVTVRLQYSTDNGANWTQAAYADGTTIPDQVTAGGGYYQFVNVPENAGNLYRVQILPLNFKADSTGTKPLYGAVSSSVDAANFATDGRDQGLYASPNASYGIVTRGFDLSQVGTTTFTPVDFGFVKKSVSAPPDLVMTASGPATMSNGSTANFTMLASNAVGSGSMTSTSVNATLTLPAGLTVPTGWPSVQPSGWSCTVSSVSPLTRNKVTCRYVGSLPLAGGADLGGLITVPVKATATGAKTSAAVVTNLSGEPSYTNNSVSIATQVQ